MRLYERFSDRGYHTSVATTFGIDFDAYESIVLPRLRGAGCRNNTVIADARLLSLSLNSPHGLPQHAGRFYTVGAIAPARGVFHPKLFLQVGRDGARLMVMSANLTPSGIAGNLELVATVACTTDASGERDLIAQAWRFLSRLFDPEQRHQEAWMLARASWLDRSPPATGPVTLADNTTAALLLSGAEESIGTRFASLVDEPGDRLVVVSPYWDRELAALDAISQRLQPARIDILVDPQTCAFPSQIANRLPGVQFYSLEDFGHDRFIHAKILVAQTAHADHVLVGSANCTAAALGTQTYVGINEEACLYRRLPRGTALPTLKLDGVLVDKGRLEPSDLPPAVYEEELPRNGNLRFPGTFVSRGQILEWRPDPAIENPDSCAVTLLDNGGSQLGDQLQSVSRPIGSGLLYRLDPSAQRAGFARVTFADASRSGQAIVTQFDTLAKETREVRSQGPEGLLERFLHVEIDADTEVALTLVQLIDELETNEQNQPTLREAISIPRRSTTDDTDEGAHYRSLSYEQFIAHRRPQTPARHLSNSFVGSNLALVRELLNRIIGMGPELDPDVDVDHRRPLIHTPFDLDDSAEGLDEHELNHIVSPSGPDQIPNRLNNVARDKAIQQVVQAVNGFSQRVKAKRARELTVTDLLRLRALLTLVCCTGLPPRAHGDGRRHRPALQILPADGNDSYTWPFLLGRVIRAVFPRAGNPIVDLKIAAEDAQFPADVLESWGACYWSVQAVKTVGLPSRGRARIHKYLGSLAECVYRRTMLHQDELLDGVVVDVMARMSGHFCGRLGLIAGEIETSHQHDARRYGQATRAPSRR